MDVQSKDMYKAVDKTVEIYREKLASDRRNATLHNARLRSHAFNKLLDSNIEASIIVEEYMYIQNKVSRKTSAERAAITLLVETAIQRLVLETKEKEEAAKAREEAIARINARKKEVAKTNAVNIKVTRKPTMPKSKAKTKAAKE